MTSRQNSGLKPACRNRCAGVEFVFRGRIVVDRDVNAVLDLRMPVECVPGRKQRKSAMPSAGPHISSVVKYPSDQALERGVRPPALRRWFRAPSRSGTGRPCRRRPRRRRELASPMPASTLTSPSRMTSAFTVTPASPLTPSRNDRPSRGWSFTVAPKAARGGDRAGSTRGCGWPAVPSTQTKPDRSFRIGHGGHVVTAAAGVAGQANGHL